jgi:hypothetical protein
MSAAGVRAGLAAARASPRRKWGGGGRRARLRALAGRQPALRLQLRLDREAVGCVGGRERVERNWLWYQVGK